jgi:hypothetical protein
MKNAKLFLKYSINTLTSPLVYVSLMPIIFVIGLIIGLVNGSVPEFMSWILWLDIGMIVLTTGITIFIWVKDGA